MKNEGLQFLKLEKRILLTAPTLKITPNTSNLLLLQKIKATKKKPDDDFPKKTLGKSQRYYHNRKQKRDSQRCN